MSLPPVSPRPTAPAAPAAKTGEITRVMVVDDSAVIRGLITRVLEAEPDIEVVASVSDGRFAVASIDRHVVDVIVLDIEMPQMDGLTALPLLLEKAPWVKIVMASTLTLKNADVTLRALSAGAADYIPKPTSTRDMLGPVTFNRELVDKVRHLGKAARQAGSRSNQATTTQSYVKRVLTPVARAVPTKPVLRNFMPGMPKVIAIGSSTGGPQALFEVLKNLSGPLPVPVLLTQHMPPTFTTILADHISRACNVQACEAQDGMTIERGRVYVAPGNYHMTAIEKPGAGLVIRLNQDAPENYCRPSVDPMMRSLVSIYGASVLAVILTGMGQDGLEGCRAVVNAGGNVIGQDEATSVVWGMPGAVATAGLCSAILPVVEIGPRLRQIAFRTT